MVNELIVDTDDRSFLQTMGDAGYSFVMGSVLSGIVQTADGVIHTVKADPKGLAQQAANATLANIKGQAAAQRIDSMRRQLMDMQRQRKVDALLAAYEENVGAVEVGTKLDESVAVGYDKLNEGLREQLQKDRQVTGVGAESDTIGEKPYTTSRPGYGTGQIEQVWENAKEPVTGKVYDPSGAEITWDTTKPRNGQWDMGHIPGEKYSVVHKRYMDGIISKEEFLSWYRNPGNYRPELPSTNGSHKHE